MEDGFYKLEDGNWLYAPNFVYGPNFELLRENKDDYTYPVDGWEWFDTSPIIEEENLESFFSYLCIYEVLTNITYIIVLMFTREKTC